MKKNRTKKQIIISLIAIVILFGALYFFNTYPERGLPFVRTGEKWSISIYEGNPLSITPVEGMNHPIIDAKKINGINSTFVADPFIIKANKSYYLFFEIIEESDGDIAAATSDDALHWKYHGIVLDEGFHLSYPYVFEHEKNFYMIPQSSQTESVRLYKAIEYPDKWEFVKDLLTKNNYTDSSPIFYNGTWYMFTSTNKSTQLRLFFADSLEGEWIEHPDSPIYSNNSKYSRGAGRITLYNGSIIRYAQDDEFEYGRRVYALEVTKLNKEEFSEILLDTIIIDASNSGWNKDGMHHVSPLEISENKWIAAVDGKRKYIAFNWGY